MTSDYRNLQTLCNVTSRPRESQCCFEKSAGKKLASYARSHIWTVVRSSALPEAGVGIWLLVIVLLLHHLDIVDPLLPPVGFISMAISNPDFPLHRWSWWDCRGTRILPRGTRRRRPSLALRQSTRCSSLAHDTTKSTKYELRNEPCFKLERPVSVVFFWSCIGY